MTKIKGGKNQLSDIQQKVVKDNMALVFYVINKKQYKQDPDLISAGFLGLCTAAAHYDESKKEGFPSYAIVSIDRAIYRHYFKDFFKRKDREVSSNTVIYIDNDNNEITLEDTFAAPVNIEQEVIGNELYDFVTQFIDSLSPRHAYIMRNRIFLDKTYTQIGKELGISSQRVSFVYRENLKRLRKHLRLKYKEHDIWQQLFK